MNKTTNTTKSKTWIWGLPIIVRVVSLMVLGWGYLGRDKDTFDLNPS